MCVHVLGSYLSFVIIHISPCLFRLSSSKTLTFPIFEIQEDPLDHVLLYQKLDSEQAALLLSADV